MAAFLVLYHFQGEPGESMESPNAFSIPKGSNSNITFGQFLDRFPAASGRGKLHYRFRSDDSTCGYVWMDMVDRSAIVPVSSGLMTCKILCVDSCSVAKRYSRLRLKANANSGEEGAAAMRLKLSNQEKSSNGSSASSISSTAKSNGTAKQNGSGPSRYTDKPDRRDQQSIEEDAFEEDDYQKAPVYSDQQQNGTNKSSTKPAAVASYRKSDNVGNLLDGDDSPSSPAEIKSRPAQKSIVTSRPVTLSPSAAAPIQTPVTPKQPVAPPKQEQDMFHFEADSKQAVKASSSSSVSEAPLSREELVSRREAATEGKVKEALEFKQEMDENSKREAEELEVARTKHEKNLLAWSTNNKEKRNVRTLLSTMHTVLWAGKGNTWKTIGLGDVIEPKQVKLQYRKAMLVVHPDRCSSLTTETKFIAKRIFEGINEAYQEFLKKESV